MNKYAPKNICKNEAQKLYDSGLSLRNLSKHFGVSKDTIIKLKLKTRTLLDANRLMVKNRVFSEQGKKSLSDFAKKRSLGGYRPHPNKGEKYKDVWFDSKWEVRVAKSLDENNISWIRPRKGFIWADDGKKYYPDFYLTEYDVYLDPKNDYLIKKDKLKIEESEKRNNIRVIVLNEKQLDWEKIKALIS